MFGSKERTFQIFYRETWGNDEIELFNSWLSGFEGRSYLERKRNAPQFLRGEISIGRVIRCDGSVNP